jgi:hypothetical protein
MHDTPLVLHERDRAVWHQQRERDVVQIVGLQRTPFKGFHPGLSHLFAELGVLNPLDFRPQLIDSDTHGRAPPKFKTD